jgi:hypothetical protein
MCTLGIALCGRYGLSNERLLLASDLSAGTPVHREAPLAVARGELSRREHHRLAAYMVAIAQYQQSPASSRS